MNYKQGIKSILNKHIKLSKKYSQNELDTDLIFFNMPITFEGIRQVKSYAEQLSESTDDELANTDYNELYLHKHKIIITSNDVITNNVNFLDRYSQRFFPRENIHIYKHFDFIENTELEELKELEKSLKKIADYENEIKLEKQKILNLNYVKSKLNKQVPNVKEYIDIINKEYDDLLNVVNCDEYQNSM